MASNQIHADRRAADSFSRSDNKKMPSLRQVNDSVYEFTGPPDGVEVSLEIIFFHGVERGDYSEAYVETWTSLMDSTGVCWPQTLLAEQFSTARILSVSYDSSIKKGQLQGNLDLYLIAENLVQDLIGDAKEAANSGLPMVLVGKDFGGLVIKAVCIKAKDQNRSTFLRSLKAIFYYGTPHLGVENLPTAFNGALAERLKFGNEEIARLGSDFSNFRKTRVLATRAILSVHTRKKAELLHIQVQVGSLSSLLIFQFLSSKSVLRDRHVRALCQRVDNDDEVVATLFAGVPELVISEASQRYDVDEYYTPNEDIDTVCKAQTRTSCSFKFLTSLISRIEHGKLMLESSPDQGLTKEGVGFRTSLGFGHDGNYVPMEMTLAEVKNALQGARIVVLHGGPGSGKSGLAKYLALQFESRAQQQGTGVAASSSAEQSDWLPNGVVFMTCGNGAEVISMQRELLRKFGVEDRSSLGMPTESLKPTELQKMLREALVNHMSKMHSCVVVILDDVWERDLLECLLVPGDRVKYLLTTQLSALWNAKDSKRVQMQDVTLEDARRILGNYANFEGGVISDDLANVSDEIITATLSHPLALATLGVVLGHMGKNIKNCQEVKCNLQEHLKTEDFTPSCFGHSYPLSVAASMMVVLKLLDEDAMNLLYNISLFDGPFILESMLQLFLACTRPRDKEITISKSKMSLRTKGLVRIEVTNPTSSSMGDDDIWVIWIHSLRQHFILATKKNEIHKITDFLETDCHHEFLPVEERSNFELAIALCALYGSADIKTSCAEDRFQFHAEGLSVGVSIEVVCPFNVKQRRQKPCHVSSRCRGLDVALSSCHLKSIGKNWNFLHQSNLVFLKYVWKRELDDENISYLLELTSYPAAPLATLRALEDIFTIELFSIEEVQFIAEDRLDFVRAILSLVHSRDNAHGKIQGRTASETSQIQLRACSALKMICSKATQEKSTAILLNVPGVLTVLVDLIEAALIAGRTEISNQLAASAALTLAILSDGHSQDASLKICHTKGLLSCLVRSLSAHYNHSVQTWAAAALAFLVSYNSETKRIICNEKGALAGLITSLFARDNHLMQQRAATALASLTCGGADFQLKVCDAEEALSGLVWSLSQHDNSLLQERAASTLSNLASGDADIQLKVCDAEEALSGLVGCLFQHDNSVLQDKAAAALSNLDANIQLKICAEGVLSGLVWSLSQRDNSLLQERAAAIFASLAGGDADVKLKVCDAKEALSGLVRCLFQHHKSVLQEIAAAALANLARGDANIQLKICADGVLSGLVWSLYQHNNSLLQERAAAIFAILACGDSNIQLKICAEGVLSGLVWSLSQHNNSNLQEYAGWALSSLACGDASIQLKICAEGVLSEIVWSLSQHNNSRLQARAAATLVNLACGDADVKLKICAQGVLSELVWSLSQHNNSLLQEYAGWALSNLARGDANIQLEICADGVLARLVWSLSQHNNSRLQARAAATLANLASGDGDIKLKVCDADGALSGLVYSLSLHNNSFLQEYAAAALANLASGDANIQLKICAELVWSLSQHDNSVLQEGAARALASLACGDADIKLLICDADGALSGLVRSLSQHDNSPLQEQAARSLANLACGDADIKLKIWDAEGALTGLVRCLSRHDNFVLQEQAAIGLANLACGDAGIIFKLCNDEGALLDMVRFYEQCAL